MFAREQDLGLVCAATNTNNAQFACNFQCSCLYLANYSNFKLALLLVLGFKATADKNHLNKICKRVSVVHAESLNSPRYQQLFFLHYSLGFCVARDSQITLFRNLTVNLTIRTAGCSRGCRVPASFIYFQLSHPNTRFLQPL